MTEFTFSGITVSEEYLTPEVSSSRPYTPLDALQTRDYADGQTESSAKRTTGIEQGETTNYPSELSPESFNFGRNDAIRLQLLDDIVLQIPGTTLSSQPHD